MRSKFLKQISVVVPAYNEADNVLELVYRIHSSLTQNGYLYEIIFIDDNSTDKTRSRILALQKKYPVVLFSKVGHKGKAFSLLQGFKAASYDNIAFIDADLQYPPEAIAHMVDKLEISDIVVANRKSYKDTIIRKTLSRGFRLGFGKLLFGLNFDIQSGLKTFKKKVIEQIIFTPSSQWTFDLEFLYKAHNAGFVIESYDITFSKRRKGKSAVNIFSTISEIGINAMKVRVSGVKPVHFPPTSKRMLGAGLRYKKKKYVTHSTLNYKNSAITTFTKPQIIGFFLVVIATSGFLIMSPLAALRTIITVLSVVYFVDVLFNLFVVAKSVKNSPEIKISTKALLSLETHNLPIYTILCPLYKEVHIIPQFIQAISKLSWPKNKLDVILLLEANDTETISKVKNMRLPSYIRIVVVPPSPPKTKPKACNYGLSLARGEYVVIYDAEDIPDPLQLRKAYLAFKRVGRRVLCLQAKLNYYNPNQNLLTRFFTAEYSLWFEIILTGLQSLGTTIPLGGTSNHFRTKDLLRLEGWDPFNVTEDADLGMRLFKDGYKTAIIDSVTLEEANSKIGNWIRQRSRWIKGYMQTYLVHSRGSLKFARKRKHHFPIFQLLVGGKLAFILINPFLWMATIAYFTLYAYVGPTIESLYPSYVFYIAMVSLVFGNFLFFYYYMVALAKKEQVSLMKYSLLIPIYWLMISIAGFMALYQLFFKPFYWEKTVHGLHLKKEKQPEKITTPRIYPRPAFGFATVFGVLVAPFIWIGDIEVLGIKMSALFFIFIGNSERQLVLFILKSVKKVAMLPVKFAYQIID